MSWCCPYQGNNNFCSLCKKQCQPLSKGCVLSKKVSLVNVKSKKKVIKSEDE